VVLFNREGRVFIGRRRGLSPKERYAWQMPQGGIDEGEAPRAAALRELFEETNVASAEFLAEAPEWFAYELPVGMRAGAWRGGWRGQTQKWFAFRFTGDDGEIDIERPGGGKHRPEFAEWRWEEIDALPELIVPFKRPVYERVVAAFRPLARPEAAAR
jgi:putative (di)nucleoside polyphosphate hydrolase